MKVHIHDEQFDGVPHSWCGRGKTAVVSEQFEATPRKDRCSYCDREWFPRGQPIEHFDYAFQKWIKGE
jgi:hypothetical protein